MLHFTAAEKYRPDYGANSLFLFANAFGDKELD